MSHIHNYLSVQSTWALLCLGVWSLLDYVKIEDIRSPTLSPEIGLDEVEVLLEVVFEGLTTATGKNTKLSCTE